jgi:UDP-2,3-diacylglucosamine pyrophosphatase LpxH
MFPGDVEALRGVNNTVVISDVHLSESVPGDDLWMRYRQRRFSPDEELGELFDHLAIATRGQALTLVFNGDVFDFDAPSIDGETIKKDSPPPTEAEAADVLERILRDNPRFVEGIAALVNLGHRCVFISGNHDAQMSWPAVRARLLDVVARIAGRSLEDRITFRSWFFRSEDGIHVEHGHQYDPYCSFRHPMEPFTHDGTMVQPTMGSLSYRHLVAHMGYFNPHVDSTFMLTAGKYIAHWARYYARSRHSLAGTWASGAIKVMRDLILHRMPNDAEILDKSTELAVNETGAPRDALKAHASLFARPVNEHAHRALRELWLDRVALVGAGVAVVGIAAVAGAVPAAVATIGCAGAFVAYEALVPKPTLDSIYDHTAGRQREIAKLHGARAIVMGHTHKAFARWVDGVFYGNSGTWSPAFLDAECTQPFTSGRPVVWLRSPDDGTLTAGLYAWRRGMLVKEEDEREPLAIEAGALVPT